MTLPVDYANATVSLDTHPDAHNETNTAVNDHETRIDALEAGGAGSTILSGTVAPTTEGTTGDYYLDTDDHILYGPKSATGYGAAQRITLAGAPNNLGTGEAGPRCQFVRAGRITGIRYQRHAAGAATIGFRVWDSGGTKVVDTSDTQASGVGYFTVTFGTPLLVPAASTYTFSLNGTNISVASGLGAASATNTADVTFLAMYATGTLNTWPTTVDSSNSYYVEPIYEPGEAWPVAVYGIPPGGTTNQFLKKTSGTDYAVAWVT